MAIDEAASYQSLPYEVHINVKQAIFQQPRGSVGQSHVEIIYKNKLFGSTPSSQPFWNANILLRLLYVDKQELVEFRLFTKKTLVVSNPINYIAGTKKVEESFQSKINDTTFNYCGSVFVSMDMLLSKQNEETTYDVMLKNEKRPIATLIVSANLVEHDLLHIKPMSIETNHDKLVSNATKILIARIRNCELKEKKLFLFDETINFVELHRELLSDKDLYHTLQDFLEIYSINDNLKRHEQEVIIRNND